MKSFFDQVKNESKANKKLFSRTDLIENVTEDIMLAMEKMDISKTELSKKLGKSKSYVTQLLSGSRNMTLSSLSDLCFELDITPEIKILEDEDKLDFSNYMESHSIYWEKAIVHSDSLNNYEVSRQIFNLDEHPDYVKHRKVAA